jgi:hypothetical protein
MGLLGLVQALDGCPEDGLDLNLVAVAPHLAEGAGGGQTKS